jgi:hypothetical protein
MDWNKAATFLVVSLLAGAGTLANASERIEESGYNTFSYEVKVLELEEGHSVILWYGKGTEITDDPSLSTHMSAIDCAGMIETMPDETYTGNGHCTTVVSAGDKLFQRWREGSDMEEGRYEIIGGTGKFEGAKGEGTYTSTELPDPPGRRLVVKWKGFTELP